MSPTSIVAAEIAVILLLILANGALAMSEIAVVSARKSRLKRLADTGSHKAAVALHLAESPDVFLSTVQIGITLVGVLAGAFGGATVAEKIEAWLSRYPLLAPYGEAVGVGIVVVVITYISLVWGELVPKRIALNSPERVASLMARHMQALARATSPLVRFLSASTNVTLRLLRIRPSAEPSVTEEEIKALMDQGTQAGVFELAERDLVQRIFKLGDRTVDMLMTPRKKVVWLDVADTPSSVAQRIAESHRSRFPICEGSLDSVLGVVAARDLLRQSLEGRGTNLREALRPALYVPEGTRAVDLLQRFRYSRTHFALVVDEHGGVLGICTLHDIMESLVGELPTRDMPHRLLVVQREDGSWLLDGMLPMDDFKELFRLAVTPAEEGGRCRTLGGFVMSILHRVPIEGDHFEAGGLRFEVVGMDGHRVDKVLIERLESVHQGSKNA